jgi:His/Glu/Gln/Arg/opine family amino acid ABC transporter permease subunit
MAVLRGGHSCLIDSAMRVLASFDWSVIWDNRGPLFDGFKNTMKASVLGIVLAYLIGLVLGALRAHRIPVLSQLAAAYVEIIRNTPILVQIFFLFYGLPVLGIHLEIFTVAWLSITIWGGAFMTENFRAGFEAVPTRLSEAGYALGFTPVRAFLNVTLPIGGRIALPSTINTAISVLKNTSLLLIIGYPELTYVANNIQSNTFRTFEMFAALAVYYLAIVWTLSALIRFLERRLALPEAL